MLGAVVAVALTGGPSKSAGAVPERGSLTNALPDAAAVNTLLAKIAQHGNVLGSPSAPATLVEYVDMQCPYCRQFELDVMPKVVAHYVRAGKLKVELRPIAIVGPDSERGRTATIAAGDQNRLFNFAQLLFANQGTENTGWLDDAMVTAAAASIPGLDVPRLLEASGSERTATQAAGFDDQATRDGVDSTPTILVGKSGESLHNVTLTSPTNTESVTAAIQAALG
jgi:protein-disulfide isomerase